MTERIAVVEAVMLADDPSTFITRHVPYLKVELGGIRGDRHFGLLRPADSRQKFYPRGTLIANRRQISMVSAEECLQIAINMGLPEIKPEWLGANILISGVGELSHLEQGTRFLFPNGTGLICEGENLPCVGPDKVIRSHYCESESRISFVAGAKKMRGIVCSVEKEGVISYGEEMKIFIL